MEVDGDSGAGKFGRTAAAAAATMTNKKKKEQWKGGNCNGTKKGFSDEQIRLLEMMFETETKPEPRKKVELARELGLHPRQVAIWFQNRRARWKSKQMEQDYRVLKHNYDRLLVDFESLKKEKQSLRSEYRRLSCMVGSDGGGNDPGEDDGDDDGSGSDTKFIGGHDCFDRKWTFCPEKTTQGGTSCKVENSVEDGYELLDMAKDEDDGGSTAGVPEKWCNFGYGDPPDYSCTINSDNNNSSSTQWWNFCN